MSQVATTIESYKAIVQDADGNEEFELVSITFRDGRPSVIETTDGERITLVAPAAEQADDVSPARRAA